MFYINLRCKFASYLNLNWPLVMHSGSKTRILFKRGYSTDLWLKPDGYPTGIKISNSVSNSLVEINTMKKNVLTWYICGPTVYDSSHIGHALCYTRLDIIRRIMENIFKLTVVPIMGITDIDNKLILKAVQEGKTVKSLAMKYEQEFIEDMKNLNILPPTCYMRVTDHMPQIVSFIKKIFDNGYAYKTDKTVYFDSVAFKRYCKLVKGTLPNEPASELTDKRSVLDFALWKIVDDEYIKWPSPWGEGRPGWHIECSAMASQAFGNKLDLHSGGMDLLFPHHESEEAQCCAYHETDQWCNYWNHINILFVKGDVKMSKSLQNTINISSMLETISADVFRMFCLQGHYKMSTSFDSDSQLRAHEQLKKIVCFLDSCNVYLSGQAKCPEFNEDDFLKELNEAKDTVMNLLSTDFHTGYALKAINHFITTCNVAFLNTKKVPYVSGALSAVAAANDFITKFMFDLGFKMQSINPSGSESTLNPHFPRLVTNLLSFRQEIRSIAKKEFKVDIDSKKKLLKVSDELRDLLSTEYSIKVKDNIENSTWSFFDANDIMNKKEKK